MFPVTHVYVCVTFFHHFIVGVRMTRFILNSPVLQNNITSKDGLVRDSLGDIIISVRFISSWFSLLLLLLSGLTVISSDF